MTKITKLDRAGLGQEALALSLTNSAPEAYRILRERYPDVDIGDLRSFQRYVSQGRADRAARVRAKIDDEVLEELPGDLDQLRELREFYRKIYQDENVRTCDRIQAADKARAVIDTKLKYSGAGAGGQGGQQGGLIFIDANGRDHGS